MGTARWAPRASGRNASKHTQHTSSCAVCRWVGLAGGVSSSRVGVSDMPHVRSEVVEKFLTPPAGRYWKRRLREATGGKATRGLLLCWDRPCGPRLLGLLHSGWDFESACPVCYVCVPFFFAFFFLFSFLFFFCCFFLCIGLGTAAAPTKATAGVDASSVLRSAIAVSTHPSSKDSPEAENFFVCKAPRWSETMTAVRLCTMTPCYVKQPIL